MVSSRQNSLSSHLRDAWVEVDLGSVEHNATMVKSWIAGGERHCSLMAVVKSDAYGHGAPAVAEVLQAAGAEWFGVASVDEGTQLRESGIESRILILSPAPFWAVENAIANRLDLTIASTRQAKAIEVAAAKAGTVARVHIKVDTGMHRLGIMPEDTGDLLDYLESAKSLELASVFSHLARASDEEASTWQFRRFRPVIEKLHSIHPGVPVHLSSSEATRLFPQFHLDMVRVGLYLYGLEPRSASTDLKPAMSVRGRINHIGVVPEGEAAGYNGTWTAKRSSRLASIPIGYADGVDRRLSNNMRGSIFGKSIEQVGLISMDQMMFDITDVPEAEEGDVITLIGAVPERLSDWSGRLDTITYELACRLRARLPRVYTRQRPGGQSNETSA